MDPIAQRQGSAPVVVAIVLAVMQLSVRGTAEQGGPAFPHDSQLLEKLHGGKFSEIGGTLEDKLSLSAVIRGFEHYACKLKGADVNPVEIVRYMGLLEDAARAALARVGQAASVVARNRSGNFESRRVPGAMGADHSS